MVMGGAGRMLHGLGDTSQPGRGIRKLQAFWWQYFLINQTSN
jgi:hypothetical protein